MLAVLALVGISQARLVGAKSLARQLEDIPNRALRGQSGSPSPATFDTFTPELVEFAVRGIDFPQASTTPGVSYSYNPALGVFEESTALGPSLLETTNTVGGGRFNLGLSFLYGSITQFNGQDIEDRTLKFAVFNTALGSVDVGSYRF